MTLRGFLMGYFGTVLLVGTAAATGYHLLAQHRAQVAARDTAAQTLVAAAPAAVAEQASQAADAGRAPDTAAPEPVRTGASQAHPFPALRPHLADRRIARRPSTVAARSGHHPTTLAAERRTTVPRLRQHQEGMPAPPPSELGYARWAPPVRYYAYPGYYRPGYAYYPSPYPYYRVY